jgi:hypothetical protein
MRRLITTLALALLVLGCGPESPEGEPVDLLTGVDGCYAGGEGGVPAVLLVHPEYGTSLRGRPVMWPVGFHWSAAFASRLPAQAPAGAQTPAEGNLVWVRIPPSVPDDHEAGPRLPVGWLSRPVEDFVSRVTTHLLTRNAASRRPTHRRPRATP